MKLALIATAIVFAAQFAIAEEDEKTKDRVGPGKAVIAANENEGFKLSEKAQKSLNLSFLKVDSSVIRVPKSSLVRFQDFLAVYRLRDGWFRLVEIEPTFNGQQASFSSANFKPGDLVVVTNGSLLRVVELDVFGPEADACAD